MGLLLAVLGPGSPVVLVVRWAAVAGSGVGLAASRQMPWAVAVQQTWHASQALVPWLPTVQVVRVVMGPTSPPCSVGVEVHTMIHWSRGRRHTPVFRPPVPAPRRLRAMQIGSKLKVVAAEAVAGLLSVWAEVQ